MKTNLGKSGGVNQRQNNEDHLAKQATPLCHHVKTNGTVCSSPALLEEQYCFFHKSARERTKRQRRAVRAKLPFQLPLLEDANSIQLAIGDTLNALLSGQIDHKTAGLILYGLQTAAGNVRHTAFVMYESSRRYDSYHNEEEETLEAEIQQEIVEEQAAAAAKTTAQPAEFADQPLPPKKSSDNVTIQKTPQHLSAGGA